MTMNLNITEALNAYIITKFSAAFKIAFIIGDAVYLQDHNATSN